MQRTLNKGKCCKRRQTRFLKYQRLYGAAISILHLACEQSRPLSLLSAAGDVS